MLQAFYVALPKTIERERGASDGKVKKIRSFNCNSLGHMLNEYRKPKKDITEKGHLAAVCPKRKPNQIHAVLMEEDGYSSPRYS